MTSPIYGPPNEYDAGLDFNYDVWTANTTVTMVNVPWNNDYRDIVKFSSRAALNTYISGRPTSVIRTTSMHKLSEPVRLDVPINTALKYNYLRVSNPAQPLPGGDTARDFYYFIVGVEYVAPQTTRLTLQLDVWQTFGFDVSFGNCYIERGHIGIANENQMDDSGRTHLTVPEGDDLGNEYVIEKRYTETIGGPRTEEKFSIMVISSVSLENEPGTVDNPQMNTATGSDFEGLPNGAGIWIFDTMSSFKAFLSAGSGFPWVMQGISSIQVIPPISRYGIPTIATEALGVPCMRPVTGSVPYKTVQILPTLWRNDLLEQIPARYRHLKKFLTYPYCFIELTTYTGAPLMLKPELWGSGHVRELIHLAPPGARVMIHPLVYNTHAAGAEILGGTPTNDGGEFLDVATGIFNFPTFSVLTNSYLGYLASNAHSIAFQHSSADWSQQKALAGAQLQYDQSTNSLNAANSQTTLSVNTSRAQAQLAQQMNAFGTVSSIAGNVGAGPGGALAGGAGALARGLASQHQIATSNDISVGQMAGANQINQRAGSYVRDTNKDLADFAARGDYENQIASITAKVQDAQMIPPSTSGQVGGEAFNLAAYKWGYDAKVKLVSPAVINTVGERWLRYGYSINRFGVMPTSLQVMSKFTYWKLRETYLAGAGMPEVFKQAIRGIFEKGVTVWANPAHIGMIDIADNDPLPGVTLT